MQDTPDPPAGDPQAGDPQAGGDVMIMTIAHSGPIELAVLADSLDALAQQHEDVARRAGVAIDGEQVRLFVRDIRRGSIVVELVALAQTYPMMGAIGAANTVITFARNLGGMIRYFLGPRAPPPPDLGAEEARRLARIVAPIAGDAKASLHIEASHGAVVVVNERITATEANEIQNRTRQFAALREAPRSGRQAGRLFYWFQARDAAGKGVGDRGVIEAIWQKPVRTRFASDVVKRQMLGEALFRKAYVVDVEVQTREGQPALYTILEVSESFDRDDDAAPPPEAGLL